MSFQSILQPTNKQTYTIYDASNKYYNLPVYDTIPVTDPTCIEIINNGDGCSDIKGLGSGLINEGTGTLGKCYAYAFDDVNQILYVGGSFTSAGSNDQNNIAAYDYLNQKWLNLSIFSTGITHSTGTAVVYSMKIDRTNRILYIGGFFDTVDGIQNQNMVTSLNISGFLPEWNLPIQVPNNDVLNVIDYNTVLPPTNLLAIVQASAINSGLTTGCVSLSWTKAIVSAYPITQYVITINDLTTPVTPPNTVTVSANLSSTVISGLTLSDKYYFTIKSKDSNGNLSAASSQSNNVIVGNTTTPTSFFNGLPAPINITTTYVSPTSVRVSWTPVSTPFDVYKSPYGLFDKITYCIVSYTVKDTYGTSYPFVNGGETSTIIEGLTIGKVYSFNVTAKNANPTSADSTSKVSDNSVPFMVGGINPTSNPLPPLNAVATARLATALIVITPNNLVNNVGIKSYTITSTQNGTATTTTFNATGNIQTVVLTLTANIDTTLSIIATDNNGLSSTSLTFNNVTTGANPISYPSQPTNVNVQMTDNTSAILSWTPPVSSSVITSYLISDNNGNTFTVSANGTSPQSVTLTSDNFPILDITYNYTIQSVNGNGKSVNSIVSNDIQPSLSSSYITYPLYPTNIIAVAGDTNATISWTPNLLPGNNNSPIVKYVVTNVNTKKIVIVSSSTTSVKFNDLINNSATTFTVDAVDANGNSSSTPLVSNSVKPNVTDPGPIYMYPNYGTGQTCYSLEIFNNTLYVAGKYVLDFNDITQTYVVAKDYSIASIDISKNIAVWNTTFVTNDAILENTYNSIKVSTGTGTNLLFVGGKFTKVGTISVNNIAVINLSGNNWSTYGKGFKFGLTVKTGSTIPFCTAIEIDNVDNILYCAGYFTAFGVEKKVTNGLAKFNISKKIWIESDGLQNAFTLPIDSSVNYPRCLCLTNDKYPKLLYIGSGKNLPNVVNGLNNNNIAIYDPDTDSFVKNFLSIDSSCYVIYYPINDNIESDNPYIYIGGYFRQSIESSIPPKDGLNTPVNSCLRIISSPLRIYTYDTELEKYQLLALNHLYGASLTFYLTIQGGSIYSLWSNQYTLSSSLTFLPAIGWPY